MPSPERHDSDHSDLELFSADDAVPRSSNLAAKRSDHASPSRSTHPHSPNSLDLNTQPSSDPPTRPDSDGTGQRESAAIGEAGYYNTAGQPRTDKEPSDWYVEGPGRRVGYDDLTAIDWIYEYTKERQRLRALLASSNSLVGHLRQLLDASHVWAVLVACGISVGCVAAFINIASDWLGDIKTGFCQSGPGGGQFYLNKQFCCWGHDDLSQCQDWTPWPSALGVRGGGGQYLVGYIFFVIFSIMFAVSAAVLVRHYSVYARHSGIPEIKTVLGGFVMRRFLNARTLITKSLGLCLAVSSGMWLGKEGPFVHLACCCANLIMKPFKSLSQNEARKREVLSAAAASGISVAFGSPIGGVLFSLEQLSYYFPDKTMWQSFVCAMVAAVTLQALNPFHTGKIVLYQVTYTTGWYAFELIPCVLLGIIGGVYGGMFIRLNMLFARLRSAESYPLRNKPILEALIVSAISAVINYPNPFMRAQLSELVYYLFAECATIGNNDIFGLCKATTTGALSMAWLLIAGAILGFLLSSITFGLQLPAGIILPTLAIGALYGRTLGVLVELLHKHFSTSVLFAACEPGVPCVIPGTYAIVGAASALAGVTRLTVSIVVIMFELTGALSYVLPIMIAVMLAKWIGDALSPHGIYESWIHFKGYPYLESNEDADIPHVPVASIMTRIEDMTCLDGGRPYTVEDLQNILRTTPYRGFPVVLFRKAEHSITDSRSRSLSSHANTLLGYISRTELSFALEQIKNNGNRASDTRMGHIDPNGLCYFTYDPEIASSGSIDLRPWMDQTPITLNANSSLQLAVHMFQKLGLRYLLLVQRGGLHGILTKKDVWWILSAAGCDEKARDLMADVGVIQDPATEDDTDEARGLLQTEPESSLDQHERRG
ncbi:chloride channel [Exophiala dermatitidis]|uniref:Chloride channel protein n=1 Tax=Exophiala dermatitidis TaxID=5970 RepID=A0AAN6IVB5_EXODE|nr:chloride channel [Exophiala dermatitidis]KAJ4515886.1 chloride channel [Exophiala dermatitidis]KAJ4518707.1 chloride channel [Exophiala dermatitidis]KAJ4534221.1 chloride channel [Exophiala dermatitidis]KAJ4545884.1 chloride channel [Exophiala dermatitidis]